MCRSRLSSWLAPWRDLAQLVWSGPCHACGLDLPPRALAGVCPHCWAALGARALPPPRAGDALACFPYVDELVTLHRLAKFGGAVELVGPLARRMARAWESSARGPVDLLVPVPPDPLRLPPRRRFVRLLARALARELEIALEARALTKWRATRAQTGRRARDRRHALTGLFVAARDRVRTRKILLVDDVTTTGATLTECRRALTFAGAASVEMLVLARTPLRVPRGRTPRPL